MDSPSRKANFLVWGALILTAICIVGAFVIQRLQRQPTVPFRAINQVPAFTLTNQFGQPVTLTNLLGSVWIADIIFSRCAGPCPKMNQTMRELQAAVPTNSPVKFVTLTTDPENDTPEVMKNMADELGANHARWFFLTGSKEEIARVAIGGLKLAAVEKAPGERENPADLFIHSTIFVLVDKKGTVQAAFDRDDPNFKSSLLDAVNLLGKQ